MYNGWDDDKLSRTLKSEPNICEPIHKDCQKDSQILANLFVNLCESLINKNIPNNFHI